MVGILSQWSHSLERAQGVIRGMGGLLSQWVHSLERAQGVIRGMVGILSQWVHSLERALGVIRGMGGILSQWAHSPARTVLELSERHKSASGSKGEGRAFECMHEWLPSATCEQKFHEYMYESSFVRCVD